MKRKALSFLDLTALPRLGALLLDPRPSWLWSEDGSRVLWANPAGVRLLGHPTIGAMLERDVAANDPLARRLAEIGASLPASEPEMGVLPFASAPLLCVCSKLSIDDDDDAILVSAPDAPPRVAPLSARALDLATIAAQPGVTAALLRVDGSFVASSEAFLAFSQNDRTLVDLVTSSRTAGRRLVKRRAVIGGARRLVGMAAISSLEGEFMLALIGPAELDRAAEPIVLDAVPAADVSAPRPTAPSPAPAATVAAPSDTPAAPFAFQPRQAPVRFVFQLDEHNRFTQLSSELGAIVGPKAADIVGKSWGDVAAAMGFDSAELVARSLARRDTWSGVTVYWPVQDSDLLVAVDLAALPAFSRSGGFEGFRGFGVCRTNDIRTAPKTTPVEESAVVEANAVESRSKPAGRESIGSNVVVLPSANRGRDLSGNEQDAFRRIAEALRSLPGRGQPPAATEPPPVPASLPRPPEIQPAAAAPARPLRLLDRVPMGLLVFRDRKVLFANRPFLDRLGYADADELQRQGGVDVLFAVPAEPAPRRPEEHRRVRLRAGDGSEVAAEARLHIVPWDDAPATMLSVRTESPAPPADPRLALADQQAAMARIDELEAVLDTATDGVVVLDFDGRIMSLNRSAEALFGIEATDVLGSAFVELLADESRRSATDYLEGLARNGVASVLNDGREVIGRVPSGGLIPMFMTVGRLPGGTFCAVLRDITHWKNAEEELVAARRTAEIASQQKSDFLAKLSHEIRTPLNAIIGFCEVMLEERFGPIGNDRYRDYLKDIQLSGSHLMSLVNDLLDLSKIEAGKLDLSFAAIPVNDVVQECVALMQPEANRRRIIIRTSLAATVPKVVADLRSLRQIVLNLLSNAVKFTPAGGQVIVSTAIDDSGDVVIRVRDTGIGMTPAELDIAMKPFRQISSARSGKNEGTGLGLPLTKALVEANRAIFAIDSTPNQGTLARVTFPTARVLPN